MTAVDARFAGGPIIVDTDAGHDTRPPLVEVNLPGLTVGLFPHEARALADALRSAADDTESHHTIRRPRDTDDQLRALDE